MVRISLLVFLGLISTTRAAEHGALVDPANRLAPNDPTWSDLAAAFARNPDGTAEFSEQRFFPFKKTPAELKGEVRLSTKRGLSLHYTSPDDHTVVIDDQGMLLRQPNGETSTPPDPRAAAANAALVQVLRFDLAGLSASFEIFGRRDGPIWALALIPRAEDMRRVIGEIDVAGEKAAVQRITIRRTAKQYIEILVGPPRLAPFTADESKRFFR